MSHVQSSSHNVRFGEDKVALHELVQLGISETGLSRSGSAVYVSSQGIMAGTHPGRLGVLPEKVDSDIEAD